MENYSLTNKEKKAREMVCLPLDGITLEDAGERISELSDLVGLFKINSLFTSSGPAAIKTITNCGADCFLDMKYHDIPNTVKNYAYEATLHGVRMFNVHASGGLDMMKAAVEGVDKAMSYLWESNKIDVVRPEVYAVTVLTSLNLNSLKDTYSPIIRKFKPHEDPLGRQVLHFAQLADQAGLDGIVCSAGELDFVRPKMRADFKYITPGIKAPISGVVGADQARVFTPAEAVRRGSTTLVIGRAITGYGTADERRQAAYEVLQDIAGVLDGEIKW
ncbi:MAG TPA: orotidine-5'-phosphate decarboxylase [Candidatus Woesearchaeota archaeon]|nr:orotidine-5'-phosphate decarboxylase [Candidatus Woesearchaeota archaeon]